MATTDQATGTGGVTLDTHQKALAINLDATSFGSFAEIGAGQEVARWFLRVGGASGTVAKTISAYDKEVSDELYGEGTRYVSRGRLEAMLEKEWGGLLQQVGGSRGPTTRLFAFADTVAARNYAGTNDCHGWIGVRFQDRPGAAPSQVVVHVNLRDGANLLQQEAVGILGVNLLHALLVNPLVAPADVTARLFDNLGEGRVEVDQVVVQGGAFAGCDMRALHWALAGQGRAEAVTLGEDGEAVAANELLYRRAVVLVPAAVHPRDELPPEGVAACEAAVGREVAGNEEVKGVLRMGLVTLGSDAHAPRSPGSATRAALLTRHEALYRATAFVRRYTRAPLRFAIAAPALLRIFDGSRYESLEGRLLEGVARLFGDDVRVLVWPSRRQDLLGLLDTGAGRGWQIDGEGAWVTADRVRPAAPMRHLHEYLIGTGFLVPMPPP